MKGAHKKVICAADIGNFVEWFDFAVYGFLATIIAQYFFLSGDESAALLKAFAVFAVAFAFRPLGGIVFGLPASAAYGGGSALLVAISQLALAAGALAGGLLVDIRRGNARQRKRRADQRGAQ